MQEIKKMIVLGPHFCDRLVVIMVIPTTSNGKSCRGDNQFPNSPIPSGIYPLLQMTTFKQLELSTLNRPTFYKIQIQIQKCDGEINHIHPVFNTHQHFNDLGLAMSPGLLYSCL